MIDWKAFKTQANGNPKKILGFSVGLATCFFVMWAFVLAKTELAPVSSGQVFSVEAEQPDSLSEEASAYAPSQKILDLQKGNSTEDGSTSMMPVVLLFGFVIVGLWFFTKKKKGMSANHFMQVMGTQQVGANQQLSLVHINQEYWVLGITNGQVSLLHRYEERDWRGETADKETEKSEHEIQSSFLALLKREEQAV